MTVGRPRVAPSHENMSFAASTERDGSEDTGLPSPDGDTDRLETLLNRAVAASPHSEDPLAMVEVPVVGSQPARADRFKVPKSR